jgi:hypothetical protein
VMEMTTLPRPCRGRMADLLECRPSTDDPFGAGTGSGIGDGCGWREFLRT